MKQGTKIIVVGIFMILIISFLYYINNIFPTYSLFYMIGGMFVGMGTIRNLDIGSNIKEYKEMWNVLKRKLLKGRNDIGSFYPFETKKEAEYNTIRKVENTIELMECWRK